MERNNKGTQNGVLRKRRTAALNAAFELFSEKSIEEVTMDDIANAAGLGVATLYRYFGTKLALCVELGALKWREYVEELEKAYAKRGGSEMSAFEEFEFYLDCYIDLFDNHKPLLRFNANFDQFTIHENASEEDMADYYDSVGCFGRKFHIVFEKARKDHTIRTDIPEHDLYFTVMYTMLPTAQKLAGGLVYPADNERIYARALLTQKEVFMNYVKA